MQQDISVPCYNFLTTSRSQWDIKHLQKFLPKGLHNFDVVFFSPGCTGVEFGITQAHSKNVPLYIFEDRRIYPRSYVYVFCFFVLQFLFFANPEEAAVYAF